MIIFPVLKMAESVTSLPEVTDSDSCYLAPRARLELATLRLTAGLTGWGMPGQCGGGFVAVRIESGNLSARSILVLV